jgi:hypothetical protein
MADGSENGAPEDDHHHIIKRVALTIGILASIAGIVGTIVALWPDPPFTIQQWAKEANAVCDDTSGEMADAAREANDQWGRTQAHWQQGTAHPGYFVHAGNLYAKLAGVQDKRVGGLSNIREPNSKADEVTEIVEHFRSANDALYASAETLRKANYQNMHATVTEFDAQARLFNRKGESVNERLTDLGAGHCVPNV